MLDQVRTKLEEGRYEGAEDVARDVRLIWSNCILYNSPGSEFGQLAAGLAKKFEERYSKIKVRKNLFMSEEIVKIPAFLVLLLWLLALSRYMYDALWCGKTRRHFPRDKRRAHLR